MYLYPPTTDPALSDSPVVYSSFRHREKAVNVDQSYDIQWGILEAQWAIIALIAGSAVLGIGKWNRRTAAEKVVWMLAAAAIRTLTYPLCWGDGPWLSFGREWLHRSGNRLATSLMDRELVTILFTASALCVAIEVWFQVAERRAGKMWMEITSGEDH